MLPRLLCTVPSTSPEAATDPGRAANDDRYAGLSAAPTPDSSAARVADAAKNAANADERYYLDGYAGI